MTSHCLLGLVPPILVVTYRKLLIGVREITDREC